MTIRGFSKVSNQQFDFYGLVLLISWGLLICSAFLSLLSSGSAGVLLTLVLLLFLGFGGLLPDPS